MDAGEFAFEVGDVIDVVESGWSDGREIVYGW